MKRFLAATVSAIVLFAALANPLPVFANDISIDGETRTFATATVVNGVMLFPVREAFEGLGFTVGWDGATAQITLTRGDDSVLLSVGSATVTLNGTDTAIEAPVQIVQDGISFMPLATVLTGLGYNVVTDTVAVVQPEPEPPVVEEPPAPVVEEPAPAPAGDVTTATVTVDGYIGPITVQVSLQDNVPVAVEVVSHTETPPFFAMAEPSTSNAIVAAGTWEGIVAADVASGATVTGQAIIDAVRQAVEGVAPVVDEPAVEEPAVEEPAAEEPADEVAEEPADEVAEEPADEPAEEVPTDVEPQDMPTVDVLDGVSIQTVTVDGYIGPITVQVSLQGNTPFAVEVVSHTETPPFFAMASPATEDAIVAAGTWDGIIAADVASGATVTGQAIIDAVREAIENVEVPLVTEPPEGVAVSEPEPDEEVAEEPADEVAEEPADEDADEPADEDAEEPADEPADEVAAEVGENGLPIATATFTPGVQTVTVPGWQEAPMTVEVTFTENQITDVVLTEHGESMYGSGWAFRALPGVPDQIVVRQSTQDIDAFTGATVTRDAVIAAVEEAITLAGADPADLEPQFITEPLPGDLFIPGFVEVTVPANTMALDGSPIVEGEPRILYSLDTDMNLRISFGRNEFHVHSGGAFGLGQGGGGHGESVTEAGGISGGTWGGWWFRQTVNHQVNDRQTTQGIDIFTGATYSAAAIIWGLEQGMIQQGGDPAAVTGRDYPLTQIQRNPTAEPDAPFFVPGVYTVTVDGYIGPIEIRVTLDRTNVRRIEILSHTETEAFWDMVWGAPADNVIRDAIFEAQFAGLDDIDLVTGATYSSAAIIEAVRQAIELAWID
ncbi:MAG: FMN-binding protein [Defluviitaleaceae bacterium]|nr:FMN-binding protein [Defluviitaleaceae bacterium]